MCQGVSGMVSRWEGDGAARPERGVMFFLPGVVLSGRLLAGGLCRDC